MQTLYRLITFDITIDSIEIDNYPIIKIQLRNLYAIYLDNYILLAYKKIFFKIL